MTKVQHCLSRSLLLANPRSDPTATHLISCGENVGLYPGLKYPSHGVKTKRVGFPLRSITLSLSLSLPLMAPGGKRETDVGLPKVVMLMKVVLCLLRTVKSRKRGQRCLMMMFITIFAGDCSSKGRRRIWAFVRRLCWKFAAVSWSGAGGRRFDVGPERRSPVSRR